MCVFEWINNSKTTINEHDPITLVLSIMDQVPRD